MRIDSLAYFCSLPDCSDLAPAAVFVCVSTARSRIFTPHSALRRRSSPVRYHLWGNRHRTVPRQEEYQGRGRHDKARRCHWRAREGRRGEGWAPGQHPLLSTTPSVATLHPPPYSTPPSAPQEEAAETCAFPMSLREPAHRVGSEPKGGETKQIARERLSGGGVDLGVVGRVESTRAAIHDHCTGGP